MFRQRWRSNYMPQQAFVGGHTVKKLECLEKYLRAYLTVFKNHHWAHTIYVDAFAGTGQLPLAGRYPELPLDEAETAFVLGSAQRALGLKESFKEYIFIEKKRGLSQELETLTTTFPDKNIKILNADANLGLKELCSNRNWEKCRAVVFLDPFGSQVEWQTIRALASTKAVDLWYLFPAGLSVQRQVRKDGSVHHTHEAALDRILGTPEWRSAFQEEVDTEPDLFGSNSRTTRKMVDADSATRFMIHRMKQEFRGGVLDDWLPLGSRNVHMFSLIFAWANPSPNAKKAGKIARTVLIGGKNGRSK
jgi:three-Cys-motif partner protein